MRTKAPAGSLTTKQLAKYRREVLADPTTQLALNAVTRGSLQEIALNREAINNTPFVFSHEIDQKLTITDQKRSGTCWMFAELNWMRTFTQEKFKIEGLEFSQNYVMFWDKLEKANFFLEQIIAMRERELDDRRLHLLLQKPLPDGGEWHMIVNLIKKYGLVPKEVMPDTFNLNNSRFLNEVVGYKLREGAARLRQMHAAGQNLAALRRCKEELMAEIYRIMTIYFGTPPEKFDWSFRDKDKKYHQEVQITPQQFYAKYVGLDLDQMYSLVSCPSHDTTFNKTYTIEMFQNMVGGEPWKWLNVPIAELKKIAIKILKKKEAVLFGCDVRQHCHSKEGLLHHELYRFDLVFQTTFGMDKGTRLDYGQSVLTHSMVLVGVELVHNRPVRWKVENSWGTDFGKKGFFVMSDKWFDEHVYDLIVPQKYMTQKLLKLFAQPPVVLPPWHCMA